VRVLGDYPAARGDRYASAVLHDEANVRIVGFVLEPGQKVGVHENPSSVVVHVTRGAGRFTGAAGATQLGAGQTAVFEPGEPHGMDAGPEGLHFLAVIAPGPSAALQTLRGVSRPSRRPAP
jgi:quercetin dioxygenase-like cupin family protein